MNGKVKGEEPENKKENKIMAFAPNEKSTIKRTIGIMSGKGGVGKSVIASMLAVMMQRQGYETGIMDADITGPSIPKIFGMQGKAEMDGSDIRPMKSRTGIKIISLNLLLDNENTPVIWRGPLLTRVIRQFWTDVIWGDVDYLFIDMPPGTADIPLTIMQSMKVDGIIVIATPQELVAMIVSKAILMAEKLNIPILGIIENMAYFECPICHNVFDIFGESKLEKVCRDYNLKILGRIPVDPDIASKCDNGAIEDYSGSLFDFVPEILENNYK